MILITKNKTMKSFILPLILCLTSCITTTSIHYSDPNYLHSNEFSTYEEITINNQTENVSYDNDSLNIADNNYTTDDYYDYSFSSRIRRFHRPIFYSNYYGGIYTDYYWYNANPFYCGTSIYNGYNWYSPYYSYYSYSPYYLDYYYTPYYYGSYYSYWYGYQHHYNTYTINNNHDSYLNGPRRSLSSYGETIRGINPQTTLLSNTIKENSTINIRSTRTKENNINRDVSNFKNNIKFNNPRQETNSNREEKSYSKNRKNNRTYNTDKGTQKSNIENRSSNNRSSGNRSSGGNKRNSKPRK